jgi:hypothetical protein
MKLQSRREVIKPERKPETSQIAPVDGPIEVTAEGFLCRLQVWTEEEWTRLPEHQRPLKYIHAPGLGWVGAVPVTSGCMN